MRRLVAALAATGLGIHVPEATADPTVTLTVRPQPPGAKTKGEPPEIIATVVDGPEGVPAGAWTLGQPGANPVAIRATGMRTYAEGDEPIAVVVLVQGHRVFLGGESWDEPSGEADAFRGVLDDLIPAIDELTRFAPPGSVGGIAVYNTGARFVQPIGPLAELSGVALGARADYEHMTARDVVSGVRVAVAELEAVAVPRKALIVIGDGAAHEEGGGGSTAAELATLKERCARAGIAVLAVHYDARLGDELSAIGKLTRDVFVVRMSDGIAAALRDVVARLDDRFYLTFPGHDPATGQAFAWDGKPHTLELVTGGEVVGGQDVILAPAWRVPRPRGFPWWTVYAGGALVLAVLAIALIARRPRPQVVAPIPIPIAAAPAPNGPMRTIAMASELGMPVVGWLVPLVGPNAYRTYKLAPGVTRIGSGPQADIAIPDPYVSAEHCEIVSGADGFRLRDAGGVNGCIVNDRKVAADEAHDLVDNDVLTIGRTHVVFKSIL